MRDRPRRPLTERPNGGRVPLTYYRAASRAAKNVSPFEQKPVSTGRKLSGKVIDLGILTLAVVAFLLVLRVSPHPVVVLSNGMYRPLSEYQASANKEFSGLVNQNKITFNELKVVNDLQKQFPEITSAAVDLPILGSRPRLQINVGDPVLILKNNQGSYLIDNRGVAVGKATDYPQYINKLISVEDQTSFDITVGKPAIDSSSVDFIRNLQKQLSKKNITIKSLILPPAPEELDLITTDQSYYVKFYLGGDFTVQTGQYLAARNNFAKKSATPSSYLDVRVEGKIFYK
jgi:hypothetical protein